MGIFDRFPYSSTHEMNLDFMLGKATEIAESLQEIDTHKEQAEQAATNAAQSAQAAAGSQTAAGTSASQAAQHKADAEDAADRAEAASNLADEAVEQAQTAAQNASTAADGAIASASAAETRINTLAASLPEDFTDLNNEVTDLKSALLYNVPITDNDVFSGFVYGSSSGAVAESSSYKRTGYMPISDHKKGLYIIVKCSLISNAGFAFYNENKNYISGYSGASLPPGDTLGTHVRCVPIPDNAEYIMLSYSVSEYTSPTDFEISYLKISDEDSVTYDDLDTDLQKAFVPNFVELDIEFSNTNHFARYDNGVVVSYNGIDCSDYIEIENVSKLRVNGKNFGSCTIIALYDSSKNFISAYPGTTDTTIYTDEVINVPANAYYMIANNSENLTRIEVLDGYKATDTNNKWTNISWVCFGDSLTAINAPTNKRYFNYIAERTGISFVNMGDSGTGYKNQEANNRAFYQRIANVPSTADVITIFGSFNDLILITGGTATLGTKDDTGTTTIGGCINTTIETLYTNNPLIKLGIISPTPWNGSNANPYEAPNLGEEYVTLLHDICEKRGIPFLDLFHNSGLRPWEAAYRTLVYSKDNGMGIHPNEIGHKIISSHIESFLDTLLLH